MKKFITMSFLLIIFSTSVKVTRSQIQFFDSVKTVAASSTYDYKNPVFSFEFYYFNTSSWIAYERHSGSHSDIVVRRASYSSYDDEIVVTNTTNALNINPSINKGIIVWQSNARGNWDIYCSVLTGENWSAPVLVDSSTADETDPVIKKNTGNQSFYYLAYKRNNSIGFKRYTTSSGIWDNDTLVTDGVNEDITPVIMSGNFSNQSVIYFLRKYSGGFTKLNQKVFYDNYTGGHVTWENTFEIYQPNPQNNLSLSYSNYEFLTYSYDTLGKSNVLITSLNGQNIKGVVTKGVPGKHLRGKGTFMPIITDDVNYFFTAFTALSKFSDSLCLTFINRPSTFNNNPMYKKIYIGDTNTIIRFDVSQPIYSSTYYYRIKTVWEKTSGGRTSLVESYLTDYLSDISNNNSTADGFHLIQNYPNPFNPVTNLEFIIPDMGFVSFKVYNALGKEIRNLVNEIRPAGTYKIEFDGSDLPSGVYFYKLKTGDFIETKRMILLK